MKPTYQKLVVQAEEGFTFKVIEGMTFDSPWHTHSECELVLLLKGGGHRMVGDNIAPLAQGDLVFLGAGLPHIWQNEAGSGVGCPVKALVVQFEEAILGKHLLELPAFEPLRQLFRRSARGLHVVGRTRDEVRLMMKSMHNLKGFGRTIQLLRILALLANSRDCHPIASTSFDMDSQSHDADRINRVLEFLNSHIDREISLSEAALAVGLSKSAFSRFFRAHTGKTFPNFINELRIRRACHLLTYSERNIAEVAYACGFANLSNFNRQFLRLQNLNPSEFRKRNMQRISGQSSPD